jgi:hypothetical protein
VLCVGLSYDFVWFLQLRHLRGLESTLLNVGHDCSISRAREEAVFLSRNDVRQKKFFILCSALL